MDKIELLKKIKSLADGVGNVNEKRNALRKLEILMKKYGVTEADLNDGRIEVCSFKYRAKFEKNLILQLACKFGLSCYHEDGTISYGEIIGKQKILLECTKAQEIEIKFLTELYLKAYLFEEKKLQEAFIIKHRIVGKYAEPDTSPQEEREKMLHLMAGIDDVIINKQISQK